MHDGTLLQSQRQHKTIDSGLLVLLPDLTTHQDVKFEKLRQERKLNAELRLS
jgi:hypothetical protein